MNNKKIKLEYLNFQNKLGDTALHNASWKGHASIVEILLQRGIIYFTFASLQLNDHSKNLYFMAFSQHHKIIKEALFTGIAGQI